MNQTRIIVDTDAAKLTDDAQMTPFLRKIIFFSSGGAFLDGYVMSIIGVALAQLSIALSFTAQQTAVTGAVSFAGILLGSLAGGHLTDLLGRRLMFIVDIVAIALASVLSSFAGEAWQLIVCRFFLGFFIGADYPIATSLIAEFAPRKARALSMGLVSASWYMGATVAAFVGFALYELPGSWRWMVGSSIVPCVVLLVGRHDIPESPRWLAQKGQMDKAREVVIKVYGEGIELEEEKPSVNGRTSLFRRCHLKTLIYFGILITCQVVPMYAIYTFGPEILSSLGLGQGRLSVLGEALLSVLFLIGTLPAILWLNSIGRRPLLIGSLAIMTVGLLIPGLWPMAPSGVVMSAFAIYAFFSGGPGILQWLYPNELFPTEVRATAVGVAIAMSRVAVVLCTYGLPLFMEAYGIGATMLVGAAFLVVGLVASVFMAPETRGLTLGESSSLSESGNLRGQGQNEHSLVGTHH